jgi:hypothetical protein
MRDIVELAVPGTIALVLGLGIHVPAYDPKSMEYVWRSSLKGLLIAAGGSALAVAVRLLLFPA